MIGVLGKILIEVRWQVVGFCAGLSIVMGLLTALLPKILGDIHHIFERLPFVKPLLTALLGVDPGQNLTSAMSQAFLWVHPTVLTLIWAHEVIYCSRMPAGEIDRGTIDFLLGLPISRWKLYGCEVLGWLVSGGLILLSGYAGHLVASIYLAPGMRPPPRVTMYVMLNLYAVYLAVGGFAFLVSAISERRGRAMGTIFAVLLVSFLVNFIAQFWDPFKGGNESRTVAGQSSLPLTRTRPNLVPTMPGLPGFPKTLGKAEPDSDVQSRGWSLATFSVLNYYRPAIIIQQEKFPWGDVGLLVGLSLMNLTAAAICLRRRSICTV